MDDDTFGLAVAAAVAVEVSGFSTLGGCLPRLSAGRFGSGGSAESSGVEVGGNAADCRGAVGGALGAGVEGGAALDPAADPAGGGEDALGAVAGGALVVSADAGLLERRNKTGGPESSFNPRGWTGAGFFAALAASEAAVSNLPSATHALVSVFCKAPVTVNRPCEIPVFWAS